MFLVAGEYRGFECSAGCDKLLDDGGGVGIMIENGVTADIFQDGFNLADAFSGGRVENVLQSAKGIPNSFGTFQMLV